MTAEDIIIWAVAAIVCGGLFGWGLNEAIGYVHLRRERERRRQVLTGTFPGRPENIRYLLCPGWVISQTDGQRHFIGAGQLADLYRVRMDDCYIETDVTAGSPKHRGLTRLSPRHDGDYNWVTL